MTRSATLTILTLAVFLPLAFMFACTGTDTATRLEGKAPFYTTVDDALAAAGEGQYIAVEFYSDW